MRDHTIYLKDILAAIDRIEEFVAGMDLEAFQADDKTSSAVLRKFEIIGEAATQIPDDYPLVWETVKRRLPQVAGEIRKILQDAS